MVMKCKYNYNSRKNRKQKGIINGSDEKRLLE